MNEERSLIMNTTAAAISIILITAFLYILDLFPVAVTTMIGLLAMVYTGVLSVSDAFAGFTNTAILLLIGMLIITDSLIECGIAGRMGHFLEKHIARNEKSFVLIIFIISAVLSMFLTNASVVAMFMPIITSVSAASNGRVTRKNSYMMLAIGGLIGGTGTLIGSTAPMLASAVLEDTGRKPLSFFSTFPTALSIVVMISILFWLFLYRFEKKCFDFPDEQGRNDNEKEVELPLHKRNSILTVIVFLTCVILFIIQPYNWNIGVIALTGALFLVVTRCVGGKKSMKNISWSTIITLGGALGLAKGFVDAGVGTLLMDWLIKVMGTGSENPLLLTAVFLFAGFFLSQFMSNGSLVAMLCSLAIPMAEEAGINPDALAMACVFGCSLAFATPVATSTITMVQVAGYRFKDYFRYGGFIGLISAFMAWLSIAIQYHLF